MDCQKDEHKCDEIWGECRCYADSQNYHYLEDQVCGIRRNGYIVPCKAGCCAGGCPGQCKGVKPREPYAFGYLYPFEIKGIFTTSISCTLALIGLSTYLLHWKRT